MYSSILTKDILSNSKLSILALNSLNNSPKSLISLVLYTKLSPNCSLAKDVVANKLLLLIILSK